MVPYIRLRKELEDLPPVPLWPLGVLPVEFDPRRHAPQLQHLLNQAQDCGKGVAAPLGVWWARVCDDAEFDPSLVFLAASEGGEIVGAAHCWTSAFIKDVAVVGSWRRRGVGQALLARVFAAFQSRGADHVDLKMVAGNEAALHFYRRLGMHPV